MVEQFTISFNILLQ